MRVYGTRSIEERTLDSVTCDVCGSQVSGNHGWGQTQHDLVYSTVALYESEMFPEHHITTVTSYDLCPGCFRSRLMPWLEGLGAKPQVEETEG